MHETEYPSSHLFTSVINQYKLEILQYITVRRKTDEINTFRS